MLWAQWNNKASACPLKKHPETMHKYDLSILGRKKKGSFFSSLLSIRAKQIKLHKNTFPQHTRCVVGSWYLIWFVKLSFITGLERKYVCIKLVFFASIHTAKVLEEDETCVMYSGFWCAFHKPRSLVLTCASGFLFPWPEVNIHIRFWSALGHTDRGESLSWRCWRLLLPSLPSSLPTPNSFAYGFRAPSALSLITHTCFCTSMWSELDVHCFSWDQFYL